ncbi:MAG TPA: hypothetical protein VIQ04_01120 [Nitrososphaeraceae archaeon]|jgi:hypothetical protein
MKTIPTIEEFVRKNIPQEYRDFDKIVFTGKQLKEQAIEFAELHVQAALKTAADTAEKDFIILRACEINDSLDTNTILNSYPLTNIE